MKLTDEAWDNAEKNGHEIEWVVLAVFVYVLCLLYNLSTELQKYQSFAKVTAHPVKFVIINFKITRKDYILLRISNYKIHKNKMI